MSDSFSSKDVRIQFCHFISSDHFYVCASFAHFVSNDIAYSIVLRFEAGSWTYWPVETLVVSIAAFREKDKYVVLAIGFDGSIHKATTGDFEWESMGLGDNFPNNLRRITRARIIGGNVYACGMGRQFFRRPASAASPPSWQKLDEGCVIPRNSTEINGFLSIDGFSESEIYAAGFYGDMWVYLKGIWQRIDSPTNLKLTCVKRYGEEMVVGGSAGILLTGRNNKWTRVDQEITTSTFRYGACFRNSLFLTTEKGELLKLVDRECERIIPPAAGKKPIYTIDGNGEEVLASTTDSLFLFSGDSWEEICLPF